MKSQHCRVLFVFRENSMITQWVDTSVTWNTFGNGVQPDGTEAEMMTSFTIPQPVDDNLLEIDVTNDVAAWIGGAPNQGWVFINDSGDGWDFDSAETTTNPPKLTVVYLVGDETLAPTAAPTNFPPTASPTSDSFFYGTVTPKLDLATGLPLLALPDGFEYFSFGWTGHIMDDGRPTPPGHDGMGVAAKKGKVIALVRNHELSPGTCNPAFVEGGSYDLDIEAGGNTNLFWNLQKGEVVASYTSLGGTVRNCQGGETPWGSWLSAEETGFVSEQGTPHGFLFDVPGFPLTDDEDTELDLTLAANLPKPGKSNGVPIKAAGRFSHEGASVDPDTGIVYETEDSGRSAIYRYIEPGAGGPNWRANHGNGLLKDGGVLSAMVIKGQPGKDMRGSFRAGQTFEVEWQVVTDPTAENGRALDSAPDAAIFARGEGSWWNDGEFHFTATSGGAIGRGQVWKYRPSTETLTLVYEVFNSDILRAPDNLVVHKKSGTTIICEDGGSSPRLIGLTTKRDVFTFAENIVNLSEADLDVIDSVYPGVKDNFCRSPGDFTGSEWAGAVFYDDWLFVNIQTPGITFAITGPWEDGPIGARPPCEAEVTI